MSKKLKLAIFYSAFIIILILIIILFLNFYNRYQAYKRYKNVFPDQPKISDIASPKMAEAINLDSIYFPYLENNNLHYFTKDYTINTYNFSSQQTSKYEFNWEIAPGSITNIKWLSSSKIIIFFIDQNLYRDLTDPDGEDLPPLENSQIRKYYFDLATNQRLELDLAVIDAVANVANNKIYTLETDVNNITTIYEINPNGGEKNILKKLGTNQIVAINTQKTLINNAIYYFIADPEFNLYRFNLSNTSEEKIFNDLREVNISPNGKFALINVSKNNNANSLILNLQTQKIDFTFPLPILSPRCIWDRDGNNLYYLMGENLKMGDESKLLNRRPSYVFFRYDAANHKNEQLNNHIYENPLDAQNLMFDEIGHKLYFIDIYMTQNSLYYLDLTS